MFRLFLAALLVLPQFVAAQAVSFTFDDGFDPRKDPRAVEWNRALLSALAQHHVEAMLFPAGRNVDVASGLELVKDWARAGHAIGNHTFSHRSLGSARVVPERSIRGNRRLPARCSV
jgi:peptidoglycan/xylan/chitin deacetylase (PgdA/CDA1 family)